MRILFNGILQVIWLEPNGPVIDCVLSSAGHSEEAVSVFFSFEL